jgi:hypothetical protein
MVEINVGLIYYSPPILFYQRAYLLSNSISVYHFLLGLLHLVNV